MSAPAEFDLIARIRERTACSAVSPGNAVPPRRDDVQMGIGDDAALLQPPPGMQLVMSVDTLVRGVHYPVDTAPADIGWKALAVNLSDLAAMGAEPLWALLALTLPAPNAAWLDAFLDGWCALAQASGIVLVGGDTTSGPEAISVTVVGQVPSGAALQRSGAVAGDRIWVSGTLGDAALALQQRLPGRPAFGTAGGALQRGAEDGSAAADPVLDAQGPDAQTLAGGIPLGALWLQSRLQRPTPRLTLGRQLRGLATACIDVSDGLLADLGHLLASSGGVGAEVALDALPTSDALVHLDAQQRWPLQLAGGDDYELCFTAPVSRDNAVRAVADGCALRVTPVGRVVVGSGARVLHPDGREYDPPRRGYQHFA